MGSWAESKLGELVDDETPNYRETKALLRMAIRETIEEAARRVRDTDEERASGYMGSMYAQLGDACATREACAKAIEAMLTDEPQRGGGR